MTFTGLPFGYEESGLPIDGGPDGKLPIPHADEALELLTPIMERCVRLLADAKPDMTDQAAFTYYAQSVDGARQVAERRVRVGPVDVEALAATIDIPAITDTLPLLAGAYEQCLSLWESPRHLMYTMILLVYVGQQQYPHTGSDGMAATPPLFDP